MRPAVTFDEQVKLGSGVSVELIVRIKPLFDASPSQQNHRLCDLSRCRSR